MQSDEVLDLFKRAGALLEGHFALSSGLHSGGYLQCALVLQHPEHAQVLGVALADRVRALVPAVVVSPALGGIIIGHEVARAVGVRGIFAERLDGRLMLRRGFQIASGERVLVVEDVVTTGSSTRETIAVVQEVGGHVVGTAAIINRAGTSPDFDVPFEVLADVAWPTHAPAECPLCARHAPLTQPGSRVRSAADPAWDESNEARCARSR